MIGRTCTFRSDVSIIGNMPLFPETVIRDEPAIRGCPVSWAQKHGGPIIQAFLQAVPEEWRDDPSTIVRAMPMWLRKDWGEGHVGWHLDGVTLRTDGQEDWIDGRPAAFSRLACNMGTNAPTRVLVGELNMPVYPLGQPLNALWSKHLREALAAGSVKEISLQEGELFVLNSSSFHSLSSASRDGWRMFFDLNRFCAQGNGILPAIEDFYREVETDFQPGNSWEGVLMSPYASDPS